MARTAKARTRDERKNRLLLRNNCSVYPFLVSFRVTIPGYLRRLGGVVMNPLKPHVTQDLLNQYGKTNWKQPMRRQVNPGLHTASRYDFVSRDTPHPF